jgi:WD40 repeat protein
VSCGVDGTVRVLEIDSGKELQCMKLDRVTVMAVAVLPDNKRVLSAGSDGIVRVWEVPSARPEGFAGTGKELAKFEGHTGTVAALAVTPDGKRVVSAGHDKTVRVWETETGRELRCFRGHTSAVHAIAVSADGKTALSGAEDNTARLWELPAVGR